MKTILIADDSASIRKLVETILRTEGHNVLVAEDGREALKLAFEYEIDAIVADEDMPHLTGTELFKILNTDPEKRGIPRIMISGLTATGDKPAIELADMFIPKDTDLRTQLIEALDRLL
jgi:OmpR family response regulator RpaB